MGPSGFRVGRGESAAVEVDDGVEVLPGQMPTDSPLDGDDLSFCFPQLRRS